MVEAQVHQPVGDVAEFVRKLLQVVVPEVERVQIPHAADFRWDGRQRVVLEVEVDEALQVLNGRRQLLDVVVRQVDGVDLGVLDGRRRHLADLVVRRVEHHRHLVDVLVQLLDGVVRQIQPLQVRRRPQLRRHALQLVALRAHLDQHRRLVERLRQRLEHVAGHVEQLHLLQLRDRRRQLGDDVVAHVHELQVRHAGDGGRHLLDAVVLGVVGAREVQHLLVLVDLLRQLLHARRRPHQVEADHLLRARLDEALDAVGQRRHPTAGARRRDRLLILLATATHLRAVGDSAQLSVKSVLSVVVVVLSRCRSLQSETEALRICVVKQFHYGLCKYNNSNNPKQIGST